jgi:hypothetical protein
MRFAPKTKMASGSAIWNIMVENLIGLEKNLIPQKVGTIRLPEGPASLFQKSIPHFCGR